MQENPRTNQQDRQKITFPGSANPRKISQQCTPATHTEAVHCQRVLLGVFHRYLWPLKAPGSTFWGRVAKPLLSDASTPICTHKLFIHDALVEFSPCLNQQLVQLTQQGHFEHLLWQMTVKWCCMSDTRETSSVIIIIN